MSTEPTNLPSSIYQKRVILEFDINVFRHGPSLADVEKKYYQTLYTLCSGSISLMAKVAGVGRETIYRRLKLYFTHNYRELLKLQTVPGIDAHKTQRL